MREASSRSPLVDPDVTNRFSLCAHGDNVQNVPRDPGGGGGGGGGGLRLNRTSIFV